MLIIDLSSVVVGRVFSYYTRNKEDVSEHTVRHITMKSILDYRKKFREYGEVVIAMDSTNYWRKDIFPNYKQNRKKVKEKSALDFNAFFFHFNRIKDEIKQVLPYTFIEVNRAEADDVIYVLAARFAQHQPVMIVSSDKDLIQIQLKFNNVKQYSPSIKKLLTNKQNDYSLVEHFIKGDSSDGIPNILSDDDVFLDENKRQRPISSSMITDARHMKNPEMICPSAEALKRYKRNMQLIDMANIPDEYKAETIRQYQENTGNRGGNVLKYMMKKRMRNLARFAADF